MSKKKRVENDTVHEDEMQQAAIDSEAGESPAADATNPTPDNQGQLHGEQGAALDLAGLRLAHGDNFGVSGYGVTHYPPLVPSQNFLASETWLNDCRNSGRDASVLIREGLEHVKVEYADLNSLMSLARRDEADRAIRLGKIVNELKKQVRRSGMQWSVWAAGNLPFMGTRNRQNYQLLAVRLDCHRFKQLGIERLLVLCSVTDAQVGKVEDPIGLFLQQHNIQFNPTEEFDLVEFIRQVDAAVNMQKLLDKGLNNADTELVRAATLRQGKFEQSLIEELNTVNRCGGDVNARLRELSLPRGNRRETGISKRTSDFNTFSARLVDTVDYIIKHDDEIERIETQILRDLIARLRTLENLLGATQRQAA